MSAVPPGKKKKSLLKHVHAMRAHVCSNLRCENGNFHLKMFCSKVESGPHGINHLLCPVLVKALRGSRVTFCF